MLIMIPWDAIIVSLLSNLTVFKAFPTTENAWIKYVVIVYPQIDIANNESDSDIVEYSLLFLSLRILNNRYWECSNSVCCVFGEKLVWRNKWENLDSKSDAKMTVPRYIPFLLWFVCACFFSLCFSSVFVLCLPFEWNIYRKNTDVNNMSLSAMIRFNG